MNTSRRRLASLSRSVTALLGMALLVVLSGCGGGAESGTAQTARPQSVAVQTWLTDNLTRDYSQVWVTIQKITAVDGDGREVTLYDTPAGETPKSVNLASLAGVGEFLSTVEVPAGLYRQVAVTLANRVQLVPKSGGAAIEAKFAATGDPFVLRVREVELDATRGTQFVLDFNLERFSLNPATGLVTPSLELPKPAEAMKKFLRQFAEVRGSVVSVDLASSTVTVDDPRLGRGTRVVLLSAGVVVAVPGGRSLTLADLKPGDRIEAKGVVTAGATTADPSTITTLVIELKPASGASGATAVAGAVKGEGRVVSVEGNRVSLALEEGNFLPGSGTVVLDVSAAAFSHGRLSDLAPGVRIEFTGQVSGTGAAALVVANRVQVQGAASEKDRQQSPLAAFVAVSGSVTSVGSGDAAGTFTLRVARSVGQLPAGSETIKVDARSALYAFGRPACLAAGREVEALGSIQGGELVARVVHIRSCGAGGG